MTQLFESENTLPEVTSTTGFAEVRQPQFVPKSESAKNLMLDVEVLKIADSIDFTSPEKLYDLGKEPADAMSAISGRLLNQLTVADTIASTQTLDQLTKITSQIEFKELKPSDYKGIRGLFHKAEDELKKRVAKYQSIGGEINKLFLSLKTSENNINQKISDINELSNANEQYAKNLDQYIALTYVLRNRQQDKINELSEKANSGDQDAQIALPKEQQIAEILDKRAFDLEQAKTMATLTAPQLKQTQDGNYNLIQQYHSAFITTIPALQTGLVQAITALQQNYAQQGINAQKEAVAKIMTESAERLAINNKFIAESSGKGIITVEDMEKIVSTLSNSVKETKAIEAENAKKREESRKQMEKIISDAKNSFAE